jgi:hypothetical protein
MARPRKRIDPEQVRKLAGFGLTQKDIASFVGCSQSLISKRFSSFYDLGVTQSKFQFWAWCRNSSSHCLPLPLHAFGVITQFTKLFRSESLDGSE